MGSNRVVESAAIVLLLLAVASLLFAAFVDILPFGFMFILTMQLAVIVVSGCAFYACRRIPGLTSTNNFWPALQLLPKRLRYLIGTAATLGVLPIIIFAAMPVRGDACASTWHRSEESCSESWREEGGVYWRKVNDQAPQQVSKRDYYAVVRETQMAFSGGWITFLAIAIGMTIAAGHHNAPMDANNALERERGR